MKDEKKEKQVRGLDKRPIDKTMQTEFAITEIQKIVYQAYKSGINSLTSEQIDKLRNTTDEEFKKISNNKLPPYILFQEVKKALGMKENLEKEETQNGKER